MILFLVPLSLAAASWAALAGGGRLEGHQVEAGGSCCRCCSHQLQECRALTEAAAEILGGVAGRGDSACTIFEILKGFTRFGDGNSKGGISFAATLSADGASELPTQPRQSKWKFMFNTPFLSSQKTCHLSQYWNELPPSPWISPP